MTPGRADASEQVRRDATDHRRLIALRILAPLRRARELRKRFGMWWRHGSVGKRVGADGDTLRGHDGATHAERSHPDVISTILETYRDMPGLSLHLHQAVRLFGLGVNSCRVVLDQLVARGSLRRTADGQYAAR